MKEIILITEVAGLLGSRLADWGIISEEAILSEKDKYAQSFIN